MQIGICGIVKEPRGLPWRSSGSDSVLPMEGAQGSIPSGGTKIPHAAQHGQKKKEPETWRRKWGFRSWLYHSVYDLSKSLQMNFLTHKMRIVIPVYTC